MSREEPEGPKPEAAADDGPSPAELGEDEAPGKDPDRPYAEPALGPLSSQYFASLDATMKSLQQQAEDLCNRINDGCKEDYRLLSGFKDSLLLKVSDLVEQLEEQLFHHYSFYKVIQEQLQVLTEVMENVAKAQGELHRICCTMEAAYRDLCLQPEA